MKYLLCLIVLVGCAESKPLKYKVGDVVETKLGETGLIILTWEGAYRPYLIDIKNSAEDVRYQEEFIVRVIE